VCQCNKCLVIAEEYIFSVSDALVVDNEPLTAITYTLYAISAF
jgi:hypothetical protein